MVKIDQTAPSVIYLNVSNALSSLHLPFHNFASGEISWSEEAETLVGVKYVKSDALHTVAQDEADAKADTAEILESAARWMDFLEVVSKHGLVQVGIDEHGPYCAWNGKVQRAISVQDALDKMIETTPSEL